MNIAVLDGHTLNPGDLDWSAFEALGTVRVYPRTPPDETVARARDADAVLTNKTRLTAEVLAAIDRLRYVGVLATGYDVVDLAAARRQGVTVTNVPGYASRSVVQATFGLLLELTNAVGHHAGTVREGRWTEAPDFCYWDRPLVELAGQTMGVVGYGAIGRAVAEVARAFGMHVLVHSVPAPAEAEGVTRADLETLFAESDVVSLHCPLTPETAGLVGAERLARMKPTALLLNTARGGLVDEAALAAALREGRLAGAGLDVLSAEPPPANHPLLAVPNCVITPHQAWAGTGSRRRLMAEAARNLRAFLDGRPRNVVT